MSPTKYSCCLPIVATVLLLLAPSRAKVFITGDQQSWSCWPPAGPKCSSRGRPTVLLVPSRVKVFITGDQQSWSCWPPAGPKCSSRGTNSPGHVGPQPGQSVHHGGDQQSCWSPAGPKCSSRGETNSPGPGFQVELETTFAAQAQTI